VAWIVFTLASAYFAQQRGLTAIAVGLGAMFFLGALAVQVRGSNSPGNSDLLRFADGTEVMVTAHVTKEGTLQNDGMGGIRQRIDVETEQITKNSGSTGSDGNFAINSGLRLNVYGPALKRESDAEASPLSWREFHYGERLRFPAKISLPRTITIQVHLIIVVILRKTELSRWPRSKPQVSRFSRVLSGAGLNSGAHGSMAASSKKCTLCGRPAKPH
jgi:Domain of unknown function (DUF4131)